MAAQEEALDKPDISEDTGNVQVQPVITRKYLGIISWIKSEIQAGTIHPGDKLPSESELCGQFDVSRSAVRQALATLVHEGWLESRKGIGTFCVGRKAGTSDDIALVCYFASSYIFPRIITSFERTVQRGGCHMIFNQSEDDLEKERGILRKLAGKGVGGIAVVPINPGTDGPGAPTDYETTNYGLLSEIRDSGIHVILLDNDFGDDRFPSIVLDDVASGEVAAQYLFDRGHRDLGVVFARNHRPFRLRKEGFVSRLSSLGAAAGSPRVVEVEKIADCEAALAQALARPDRPSAYFCANDEMAVALYKAAARQGLRIPGDVSAISVDNSDYAQLPGIDLTSIDHPSSFMGVKAAQSLIDGIGAPEIRYRSRIVIEPTIVERGSVENLTASG